MASLQYAVIVCCSLLVVLAILVVTFATNDPAVSNTNDECAGPNCKIMRQGETGHLPCNIDLPDNQDSTVMLVTWTKSNTSSWDRLQAVVSFEPDAGSIDVYDEDYNIDRSNFSLIIINAHKGNEGYFQCRVIYNGPEEPDGTFNISLKVDDISDKITSEPPTENNDEVITAEEVTIHPPTAIPPEISRMLPDIPVAVAAAVAFFILLIITVLCCKKCRHKGTPPDMPDEGPERDYAIVPLDDDRGLDAGTPPDRPDEGPQRERHGWDDDGAGRDPGPGRERHGWDDDGAGRDPGPGLELPGASGAALGFAAAQETSDQIPTIASRQRRTFLDETESGEQEVDQGLTEEMLEKASRIIPYSCYFEVCIRLGLPYHSAYLLLQFNDLQTAIRKALQRAKKDGAIVTVNDLINVLEECDEGGIAHDLKLL